MPASRRRCAVSFKPVAATWSRQGESLRMPWRAHPAMISGSAHCLRTVAVLIDSSPESGSRSERIGLALDAVPAEQGSHTPYSPLGIGKQPRSVGQLEELDKVQQAPRALLPADHYEVILMAVEPCEEHHAGLVEARRRAEHVTRQRDGWREYPVELLALAGG